MACQQLAIAEDLSPRRPKQHFVSIKEKASAGENLTLLYGSKPASVIELPWPIPEEADRVREFRPHLSHRCGLYGGHRYACVAGIEERCSLPDASPCPECERRVRLSYKAGRYVSR